MSGRLVAAGVFCILAVQIYYLFPESLTKITHLSSFTNLQEFLCSSSKSTVQTLSCPQPASSPISTSQGNSDETVNERFDFKLDIRPENDHLIQGLKIPTEQRLVNLQKWIERNGGTVRGFRFEEIAPDYRGLFTIEELPVGYEFLSLPRICMMDHTHWNYSWIGHIIQTVDRQYDNDYLAMIQWWLLIERFNPNSIWKYVIAALPSTFDTVPLFWKESELKELEGSYLLDRVKEEKKETKQRYERYTKAIPQLKTIKYEDFMWSRVALGSRVWGVDADTVMLPMLDMINHIQPEEHLEHVWRGNGTAYVTTQTIPVGSQLYFHYGIRSQTEWLQHYGFTTPHNEKFDELNLKLSVANDDPFFDEKVKLLEGQEITCDLSLQYPLAEGSDEEISCFNFARLIVSTNEANLTSLENFEDAVSLSNELLALQLLSNLSNLSLSRYSTTLLQDEQLLTNNPNLISTNFNYYNAIYARLSEKKIYQHYLILYDLLKQFEPIVNLYDNSWPKLSEWLIKNIDDKNDFIGEYFVSISEDFWPGISTNSTNSTEEGK